MRQFRHPLPARIFHWTLAPLAITLVTTGLYITNPPLGGNLRHVRQLHSFAGFLFTGAFLARLYYALLRREWRLLLPERPDLQKLPAFARYQLYLTERKPRFRRYNVGQKLLYTFWSLAAAFILPLGFFLYAPQIFARPIKWLGGLARVRQLVYYLTLVTATTMAGHVYLALTDSIGKLRSMFTGYYQHGT